MTRPRPARGGRGCGDVASIHATTATNPTRLLCADCGDGPSPAAGGFCVSCGARLVATRPCRHCGASVAAHAKHCGHCGGAAETASVDLRSSDPWLHRAVRAAFGDRLAVRSRTFVPFHRNPAAARISDTYHGTYLGGQALFAGRGFRGRHTPCGGLEFRYNADAASLTRAACLHSRPTQTSAWRATGRARRDALAARTGPRTPVATKTAATPSPSPPPPPPQLSAREVALTTERLTEVDRAFRARRRAALLRHERRADVFEAPTLPASVVRDAAERLHGGSPSSPGLAPSPPPKETLSAAAVAAAAAVSVPPRLKPALKEELTYYFMNTPLTHDFSAAAFHRFVSVGDRKIAGHTGAPLDGVLFGSCPVATEESNQGGTVFGTDVMEGSGVGSTVYAVSHDASLRHVI